MGRLGIAIGLEGLDQMVKALVARGYRTLDPWCARGQSG